MQKAGLEGLEERLAEVERKLGRIKKEQQSALVESGRVLQTVKDLQHLCEQHLASLAATRAERDAAQERLLAWHVPDGPLDDFVRTRCGQEADSRAALRERASAAGETRLSPLKRSRQVVLNVGVAFGFVYDEPFNTLHDRRGRRLADVREAAQHELREQEELISEQTLRLFRQLVMDNLVSKLQSSVLRLQEMARRIGQLLRQRTFGNNR
jgi:hypothetical protein